MADKLIRIKPATGMAREQIATGSAVVVKSGGWVTHRIHWEAPSSEPAKDDNSEPLVNGRACIPPKGRFTRFWISTETVQRQPEDILLLVIDEVSPVVLLNEKRSNVETQLLASSDTAPITPTGGSGVYTLVYTDQVWTATTKITDVDRRMFWPSRYLAGCAIADQPFVIKAYSKITSQNGTALAPYAFWNAQVTDTGNPGVYGCDFLFGAKCPNAQGTLTEVSTALKLPFPPYGISLYVTRAGANDLTSFTYSIFAASDN